MQPTSFTDSNFPHILGCPCLRLPARPFPKLRANCINLSGVCFGFPFVSIHRQTHSQGCPSMAYALAFLCPVRVNVPCAAPPSLHLFANILFSDSLPVLLLSFTVRQDVDIPNRLVRPWRSTSAECLEPVSVRSLTPPWADKAAGAVHRLADSKIEALAALRKQGCSKAVQGGWRGAGNIHSHTIRHEPCVCRRRTPRECV